MVRIAFGKQRLAISRMEFDMSIVISLTISLLSSSMRISASVTTSAATPFTIAMMVPLPPCEVLLLTIVYSSPLLGAVYWAQNEAYMCRSAENVVRRLCFNKLCTVG